MFERSKAVKQRFFFFFFGVGVKADGDVTHNIEQVE